MIIQGRIFINGWQINDLAFAFNNWVKIYVFELILTIKVRSSQTFMGISTQLKIGQINEIMVFNNQQVYKQNLIKIVMGGCAGCMGPKRRQQNYKVNRLTENSPIKSRLSISELPVNRNKDRIMDELNQQKRKYDQNNLISTLINSPIKPITNEKGYSNNVNTSLVNVRTSFFEASPEIYQRDSYLIQTDNVRTSGMIKLKRVESNSFLDQNSYQNKHYIDKQPFTSEFRTGSFENQKILGQSNKVLSEIRLNRNSQINFKKKDLSNIPELTQQQSKTPLYVKQIRKQNGEDVKSTDLQSVPKKLEAAPRLNLHKYLKDLI